MRVRLAAVCVAAFAGCGGGGGGGSTTPPVSNPSTAPTATSAPTSAPSANVTVGSTSQSATVAAGGTSAAIGIPPASASTSVAIAASSSLPPGASPLLRRRDIGTQSSCPATFANLAVSFTATASTTFTGIPQFTITLPSSVSTSGVSFYIAYLAPGASAWQEPFVGPATVNGQTLTFAASSIPITLTAGQTYTFALYTQSTSCGSGPLVGLAAYGPQGTTVSGTVLGSATSSALAGTIAGSIGTAPFMATLSGTISGGAVTGTVSGTGITGGSFSGTVSSGGALAAAGSFTAGGNGPIAFEIWGSTKPGAQIWYFNGRGSCSGGCLDPTDYNSGGFAVDSGGNVAGAGSGQDYGPTIYCVRTTVLTGTFSGTTWSVTGPQTLVVGSSMNCSLPTVVGTGTANAAFPNATTLVESASGPNSDLCFAAALGAMPGPCTLPTSAPTSSPTGSPSGSPSAAPSGSPNPSPSPSATPLWTFGGSSTSASFTAGTTPSVVTLSAYRGVTVGIQWAAPVSGTGSITFTDAINSGDVTPNTLPADNAAAGYTPIIYIDMDTAATIDFGTSVPSLTVTSTALSAYATCSLDVLQGNLTWMAPGVQGSVASGKTVIGPATLPAGNDVKIAGQQIVAISCK